MTLPCLVLFVLCCYRSQSQSIVWCGIIGFIAGVLSSFRIICRQMAGKFNWILWRFAEQLIAFWSANWIGCERSLLLLYRGNCSSRLLVGLIELAESNSHWSAYWMRCFQNCNDFPTHKLGIQNCRSHLGNVIFCDFMLKRENPRNRGKRQLSRNRQATSATPIMLRCRTDWRVLKIFIYCLSHLLKRFTPTPCESHGQPPKEERS